MIFTEFAPQSVLNSLANVPRSPSEIAWDNLCVSTSVKHFHKKVPETSLSILTNDTGVTHIKIDGKEFNLCSSTYLIVNPFQELDYTIESKGMTTSLLNFHFNYGFSLNAFGDLEQVLEEPDISQAKFPVFYNELLYKDQNFQTLINKLQTQDKGNYDVVYGDILHSIGKVRNTTNRKIRSLDFVKSSTKIELFNRISMAKDIIYSEYKSDLTVEDISKRSMLSKYHLIRCFKAFYGHTPYEMLRNIRLEKAKEYLSGTNYPVGEIASLVGFEEANSLSNAFRNKYKVSPTEFRISNFE